MISLSSTNFLRFQSLRHICHSSFIYHAPTHKFQILAERALKGLHPYQDRETFLKVASLAAHSFPLELRSSFHDFKLNGNQKGYFLIRSLPCDPCLMDTPKNLDDVPTAKQSFFSEFWLASLGGLLGGDLFSYVQENNGNLIHNVRPDPKKADLLCSESSTTLLDLHSETAFHPFYPDYLALLCLRSDRDGKAETIISSLRDIQAEIPYEMEQILRQNLFKTGIDLSFGSQNGFKGNGPIKAILYGDRQDPLCCFDPDLMEGTTEAASRAMITLKELFDKKREGVLLKKGDLIVIDNHRALHGRNSFVPHYDGKDRWLQRAYITRNLQHANQLFGRKNRIISHVFSTQHTQG